MRMSTSNHEQLKQYYGKLLQGTKDLKSSACCCGDGALPPRIRGIIGQIDEEILSTGKPMLVCGNTASMLQNTRFSAHFRVIGDRAVHYGPFDCAPASVKAEGGNGPCSGGACC